MGAQLKVIDSPSQNPPVVGSACLAPMMVSFLVSKMICRPISRVAPGSYIPTHSG